jgi:hypothetical protein
VTKNKKEYKKEYKEYNFGVQRVHPFFVLDACTLLLFFVLEKSGHPDFSYEKKTLNQHFSKNKGARSKIQIDSNRTNFED